jgi:hypothetical protein
LEATGAAFTRAPRWLRIAPDESATSRAVSPMVFSLPFRKGPILASTPLTLSASVCVPAATCSEPSSRSPAPLVSFVRPLESLPLPSLASFRPAARSLEPFSALPMPPLSLSAPFAALTVCPWMSENEMKILSRKDRDAFVDAAWRTSPNTVREICPTM